MINNRMWLESNGCFPNSQYGFRMNRSCIDNASILHSEISLAQDKNICVVAAFLDIKAAYDNVLCDVLVDKLMSISILDNTLAFINNLVSFRRVYFSFDEIDEFRSVFRGLPQGSVLSPLLYIIYTKDLEKSILAPCRMIQYADDIAIYSIHNTPTVALHHLEDSLFIIASYLGRLGLSLSTSKTKLCVFEPRSRLFNINNFKIRFNNVNILCSSHIKFLNVIFQHNFKWNEQFKKFCNGCILPFRVLSCYSSCMVGC